MPEKFMWRFLFTPERVVDGDTIEGLLDRGHKNYSRVHVRLLNINTPELKSKIPEERAAAQAAKQFLIDTLDTSKAYVFESRELDAFGRSLGLLYLTDTQTVNDLILSKGLAVPFKK